MERKTAEQTLKELYEASPMGCNDAYETWEEIEQSSKDFIIQAMQSYADQEKGVEAVGFAEWLQNRYRRDFETLAWVGMKDIRKEPQIYATSQLYALYQEHLKQQPK